MQGNIKLPSHILNALKENKTSLGEHPSYPPEEEEKFIVNAVSRTFNNLVEKVDTTDSEELKERLSKLLAECKKLERNNVQALEKLCSEIVTDFFDIPTDTLSITSNIVDRIDVSEERLVPEPTKDFSFDDIEDMNNLTSEVYKRRILNALVAGASMYYMNIIGDYIREVFEINSDLPSLYKKIIDYNNVLLYIEKDTFDKGKATDGGRVDVVVCSDQTYAKIKAQGLLFPILLEETIKGILELAISHGLPQNIEKAKYVIGKSDFKIAEVWDMRLGYALWCIIEEEADECGYDMEEVGVNYFLMELSEMGCDTFNKTLQEIFARTRKGKELLEDIFEHIMYNKEKDDFDDFIKTRNDSTVQINDDEYFSPEELITDDFQY